MNSYTFNALEYVRAFRSRHELCSQLVLMVFPVCQSCLECLRLHHVSAVPHDIVASSSMLWHASTEEEFAAWGIQRTAELNKGQLSDDQDQKIFDTKDFASGLLAAQFPVCACGSNPGSMTE